MQITTHTPADQIDIAVELGEVPRGLPSICSLREFAAEAPTAPAQIIDGVLHQGCKMILGGTSKSNKSWCLLDLALSVASGQKWWGRTCTRAPVLYMNFELHPWALANRLRALSGARQECKSLGDMLYLWNLRGHSGDLTLLRPQLEERLREREFAVIILDPAYKVLGERDENSNGEIAGLMNELEMLAQSSGAAVVLAHHFAKGDSSVKEAGDRLSGAGAWVRDPDSILVLTPHEEQDCYTVTSVLRNLPRADDFVVAWEYPLMKLAPDLNPGAIRRGQTRNKVCSDKDFMTKVLSDRGKTYHTIVLEAQGALEMSKRTTTRYLKRLVEAGLVRSASGLYWVPTLEERQRGS